MLGCEKQFLFLQKTEGEKKRKEKPLYFAAKDFYI